MANITIPYGHTHLTLNLADQRLQGILESRAHQYRPIAGEKELVKEALEHPLGSQTLADLAKGKQRITIIASDHTRPVPTKIIAPLLLEQIRSVNPQAEITFLIATGFHRATTQEELVNKFGADLYNNERIVIHDGQDSHSLVNIGKLPSGGDLIINKLAAEADLLIAEGFIEPHLFAGFSGGRKSVLPGIASRVTVLANHCAEFIANEHARSGSLADNPIHTDMLYAAKKAKLAFIANVVLDADKKIIQAFAGDLEEAHLAGCRFVDKLARVTAKPADIVITSNGGYPLDQNIYQHVKSLSSAESTCKKGGVIIACAACNDGHGSEDMYNWLRHGARSVMDRIMQTDRNSTIPDQWASQIMARIQLKHRIIFVTDQCDHQILQTMGFDAAPTLEAAMVMAEATVGSQSKVTVIPDGVSVIID